MRVKATRRDIVEVDISESDISDLIRKGKYNEISTMLFGARRSWAEKCGYTGDVYIKDGKWFEDIEQIGGSHSWTTTEELGKASRNEVAIWDSFQVLNKELGKL